MSAGLAGEIAGKKNDGKYRATPLAADTFDIASLMWHDSANAEAVRPASAQADQLTKQANQEEFAKNFAGVTEDPRSNATDPVSLVLLDANELREFAIDAAAATYEVGDLLGPSENGGGTALLDTQVEEVFNEAHAIFYVTRAVVLAAVGKVRCRLLKKGKLGNQTHLPVSVLTLAADLVLTDPVAQILTLDPGGVGRNVDLPPEAGSEGVFILLNNAADAAETLTVRDDAGAVTIATVDQNERALLWCDGTTWFGLVGANT